ncbi:hypothetical protein BB559_003657 [Furculomyces boomerangus]|uniref:HIT-type domain-containing protein n=1 Tax=Furculomyces boomerangus TaxID=61424 RepID=A0A2T9YJU9_9FUNG|nr:hypothetical protein BB559_003657 [Furculomyces boomerangus]
MSTNTSLCAICSLNPKKYKCPVCETPYCTIACYKIHKENPCQKKQVILDNLNVNRSLSNTETLINPRDSDEQALLLKDKELCKIETIKEISQSLKEKRLKVVIDEILYSDKPLESIRIARNTLPEFENFVSLLSPLINGENP